MEPAAFTALKEHRIVSVANNTRADGRAFLEEAAAIPIRTASNVPLGPSLT